MPNIKSAEKRVKVIEKKTDENKAVRSKVATYAKKVKAALETGDAQAAQKAYAEFVSVVDKAVSAKVVSANSANRKKAHYAKLLDNKKSEAK